jgi:hypothetical protein
MSHTTDHQQGKYAGHLDGIRCHLHMFHTNTGIQVGTLTAQTWHKDASPHVSGKVQNQSHKAEQL